MPKNSETSAATDAPPCEKCGAVTFATTRTMRTHDLDGASAIARVVCGPGQANSFFRFLEIIEGVARQATLHYFRV